ncbi:MAG: hypothetical protein KDB23_15580 [Planctomycetales bacterium]|nr:hypothetical protein [Planctomycetales bacterium]
MKPFTAFSGLLFVSLMIGCQAADDPKIVALRSQYRLTSEPTGAVGILAAREQMLPESTDAAADATPNAADLQADTAATEPQSLGPTEPEPVVLVGRIGGGSKPTWDEGRAAFVMMDTASEAAGHDHGGPGHDDNCPFCKAAKHGADGSAFVQFVDDEGNVVPVDARKLLAVQEGQLVVVQGTGMIDELGNLVVNANGIYSRQ